MADSSQGYSSPLYGTATFTNSNSSDSDRSSSSGDDAPSIPFFPVTTYAGRILSMITERTEPTTSRPPSGLPRQEGAVPEVYRRSARQGGSSSPAATDSALPQQGRGRAGELIAFFEDKRADAGAHSRMASAPGDQRSSSPYLPASQSTPAIGSTTAYGSGLGTGYSSTSPRSPLASVRNIVAAWKERTPASPKSSAPGTVTSASSPFVPGHLGLRRQPARIGMRRDETAG